MGKVKEWSNVSESLPTVVKHEASKRKLKSRKTPIYFTLALCLKAVNIFTELLINKWICRYSGTVTLRLQIPELFSIPQNCHHLKSLNRNPLEEGTSWDLGLLKELQRIGMFKLNRKCNWAISQIRETKTFLWIMFLDFYLLLSTITHDHHHHQWQR